MTDVPRSDTLDRLYQMSGTDSREERRERLAWVRAAGGEVR